MAELLIKAFDHIHRDPIKDRSGAYKRGDPVIAMRDGNTWGTMETLPTFWKLRVANTPVFLLQEFCVPEHAPGLWLPGHDLTVLTRRLYSLKPELLAPRIRADMLWGNIPTITYEQFQKCCVRKREDQSRLIWVA